MKKYDRSKSGFYGKKHIKYSKELMSIGRKMGYLKKREVKEQKGKNVTNRF